jgi:zinc protease
LRKAALRLLLGALILGGEFATSSRAAIWPEQSSDLAPDPSVRRGMLPNGLRYAIRPNSEPRGRVSMRLLVAVGSLHERDDERGLAHFVEHMVFRGTRQHPNGSLSTELQRLGIAFGPENTAFTHPDHTIYHLDLPEATDASLRRGLSIFREYASDVTFAKDLIEKERGVVLSELAMRDTPDARAGLNNLAFLWPQSRQVQRTPIGLEASIRHFNREQFVSFYDAWYRPERMAVIISGDIAPEAAEQSIRDVLSSMTARGMAREEPGSFEPAAASNPNIRIYTDPGLIGASCTIQHPFPEPRVPDSHAQRVRLLHRSLAFSMFQRRLTKAAADSDGPAISPQVSVSTPVSGWGLTSFGSNGRINNWREFMIDIEQKHRRAFLHGFTQAELRAAKTTFATAYAEAVRTAPTWPSGWIAEQLATCLLEGTVFSTPAIIQQDIAADLEAATAADCVTEFRTAWSTKSPHVFIATNPEFKVAKKEIADALNASRQIATTPPVEKEAATFAYTDFGPTAPPVRETFVADLDVHQAEFGNGVRLNFKHTGFEANTVDICVRVGRGKLSQPPSLPGLDFLANQMVSRGGLGRHTFEEVQEILNGHTLSIGFNTRSDAFEFAARCARPDLLLCLQVIAAHLVDTAYRPAARRQVEAIFGSLYANLAASAGGPFAIFAQRVMSGGDRHLGVPMADELFARTDKELVAWIEPELKHGSIELSIVGDTDWNEASQAVSQTFAALPTRDPMTSRVPGKVRFSKPKASGYVYTTAPQLKQVALAWYCPVTDLVDMHHERRCRLLADLINERLRLRLREELGAAYGCSTEFNTFDGLPDYSFFSIYTEVAPQHAQQAAKLMKSELVAISKNKFSDDEFERVKQPFLRRREQDLRQNLYWAFTVLRDAQERPQRLDAARDRSADTAAITRGELEQLTRRYFDPRKCFHFTAYPGAPDPVDLRFGRK